MTQIEDAVGSAFDDDLTGTHGVINVLDGAAGTDTCYARPDAPPAGDLDQVVNCETTPTIIPATPTNLSTDQTGPAPVLNASFFVADGGSGSVIYTVWDDDPDLNPSANIVLPPRPSAPVTLGGDGETTPSNSPLSLDGVPLIDGQTYYWKAAAIDGVEGSQLSSVQRFTYAAVVNCDGEEQFFVYKMPHGVFEEKQAKTAKGAQALLTVANRDLDVRCDASQVFNNTPPNNSGDAESLSTVHMNACNVAASVPTGCDDTHVEIGFDVVWHPGIHPKDTPQPQVAENKDWYLFSEKTNAFGVVKDATFFPVDNHLVLGPGVQWGSAPNSVDSNVGNISRSIGHLVHGLELDRG